jgi:FtsZ-interacting cell division protein ZipA
MGDLTVSLIILAALVVVGLYAFNRLQERKYRREAEDAFRQPDQDALLDEPAAARVKQRKENLAAAETNTPAPVAAKSKEIVEPTLGLDPIATPASSFKPSELIDFVASIRCDDVTTGKALKEAVARYRYNGKPVRWLGRGSNASHWVDIAGPEQNFAEYKAALQLSNRTGPATELDIASFVGMVKNVAAELKAHAEFANESEAQKRAEQLDQFCAEVDLLVGVNVISTDGGSFPATKIRALVEADGMSLEPDGAFRVRDENVAELFSLVNQEPRPFLSEHTKSISTTGVTFLLDVPRTANGCAAFDRMASAARRLSEALQARVVDDKRMPLTDSELKRIRAQLDDIYARMAREGIAAGSPDALRLFSE